MVLIHVFLIAFRRLSCAGCWILIWLLMPVKLFAYGTRWRWLRRTLLEITTFFDFLMVFALVQNEAMRLHGSIYHGNFIFGKAVMIVDGNVAEQEIAQPSLRGNRFMGVDIVTNDPMAFATNAGPITTSPPTRDLIRSYIDTEIMTERVRNLNIASLQAECGPLLAEWASDRRMTDMWAIRGAGRS